MSERSEFTVFSFMNKILTAIITEMQQWNCCNPSSVFYILGTKLITTLSTGKVLKLYFS